MYPHYRTSFVPLLLFFETRQYGNYYYFYQFYTKNGNEMILNRGLMSPNVYMRWEQFLDYFFVRDQRIASSCFTKWNQLSAFNIRQLSLFLPLHGKIFNRGKRYLRQIDKYKTVDSDRCLWLGLMI